MLQNTSFSVGLPTLDSSGRAVSINSLGQVDLLRTSNNAPWRSYKQTSIASVTATPYTDDSLPVGVSISGYWSTPPVGYLPEDGSAVSRTTYAALFAAISTTYGAGDGSTTFNLPNSKGRVAVNLNSSDSNFNIMGKLVGEKYHTLTVAELPPQQHGIRAEYGAAGNACCGPPGQYNALTTNTAYGFQTAYTQPDGGGGQSYSVIQPYITKLSAIKYMAPSDNTVSSLSAGTSIDGYWSSATPPAGYLAEDGSAISRTTYSALFSVIGTTYGAGDGSTTFNLPDSRGRAGVNLSSIDANANFNVMGRKYGEDAHTLTVAEIPPQQHGIKAEYGPGNTGSNLISAPPGQYNQLTTNTAYPFQTIYATTIGTNDNPHNIIQPSIVKLSVIKYTPANSASASTL